MAVVITHATVAGDPQDPLLGASEWNENHVIAGLDELVSKADYSPSHSILVQQSGTGNPTALQIGNNTLLGRLSGGGSQIDDLSATDVRTLLSISNVDNTSDLDKPISTATQTALDLKLNAGKITVGTTAPVSPSIGDLWVDTN